jgi:hypothetical protein
MGLIRGVARTAVIAGTATAVSNRVSRRQAGRWATEEQADTYQQQQYAQQQAYAQQQQYAQQQAYAQQQQPAPPPAQDDMDAIIAALKQLGDLHAQGILTDAEFEAQKRKLLSS